MKQVRCPTCDQWRIVPSEPGDTVALGILKQVADEYRVRIGDIIGPSQAKHFVEARYAAARALLDAGYIKKQIGRILRRDHSTISVGLNGGKKAKATV